MLKAWYIVGPVTVSSPPGKSRNSSGEYMNELAGVVGPSSTSLLLGKRPKEHVLNSMDVVMPQKNHSGFWCTPLCISKTQYLPGSLRLSSARLPDIVTANAYLPQLLASL